MEKLDTYQVVSNGKDWAFGSGLFTKVEINNVDFPMETNYERRILRIPHTYFTEIINYFILTFEREVVYAFSESSNYFTFSAVGFYY